jgi:hypothetical protein
MEPGQYSRLSTTGRYLLAYKYVANEPYPSGNISPKSFVQLMAAGGGVITLDELGGLNPCSDNGLV